MPLVRDGVTWDGVIDAYIPDDLNVHRSVTFHTDARDDLDPVTYEVVRHAIWSINEEHGERIVKASGSPNILYGHDYNTAVLVENGDWVYFGPYLQYLCGGADSAVKYTLEYRSANPGINEGDIFFVNDPWIAPVHQSDAYLVAPVFIDGRLFCWAANSLHSLDVGGSQPGSACPDAQDVFSEGVPTPPIKLVESSVVRLDVLQAILRRSRFPDLYHLDLRAQIAGCELARKRLHDLADRYGPAVVKGVMRRVTRTAATAIEDKLSTIPDGTWQERGYLEVAAIGDRGIYRHVLTLRKEGSRLTWMNEGTDDQIGSISITYSSWRGALIESMAPVFLHDLLYAVGGLLEHMEFRPTPGTLTCARHPAAVSIAAAFGLCYTQSLASRLLARMVVSSDDPELRRRGMAPSANSTMPGSKISGTNQRGEEFATGVMDAWSFGIGGMSFRDGVDTGGVPWAPKMVSPNVEDEEEEYPVLYLWRRELPDSGGAGRWRGGNISTVAFVPYGTDHLRHMTTSAGLALPSALGVFGGLAGCTGEYLLARDSEIRAQWSAGRMPDSLKEAGGSVDRLGPRDIGVLQHPDDVFQYRWSGSGGWGDPLRREPERVARDVRDGHTTVAAAADVYGLVLDAALEVQHSATHARREQLRQARLARANGRGANASAHRSAPTGLGPADAVPVHELLHVDADDNYVCGVCATVLGPASRSYKWSALWLETGLEEANPLNRGPELYIDAPVALRQFICPGCAVAFDSEMIMLGDKPTIDFRADRGPTRERDSGGG